MSTRAALLRGGVPAGRTGAARFVDDERGDRTDRGDRGDRGGPDDPQTRPHALPEPTRSADVGLWVFIGVATSLFSLFLLAFALRMNGSDWVTIALPRQLWLSTALLVAGSVLMQRAGRGLVAATAAALPPDPVARSSWLAAGALALAFLAVQLWAGQEMSSRQVSVSGNPAASFFYLLTAMHGLHVAGGLVAWLIVDRRLRHGFGTHASRGDPVRGDPAAGDPAAGDPAPGDPARADAGADAWRVALCARYWHFLLAVWIALYAAIGWLSPDFVRYLCGTA